VTNLAKEKSVIAAIGLRRQNEAMVPRSNGATSIFFVALFCHVCAQAVLRGLMLKVHFVGRNEIGFGEIRDPYR
jgi:hypothetical protein